MADFSQIRAAQTQAAHERAQLNQQLSAAAGALASARAQLGALQTVGDSAQIAAAESGIEQLVQQRGQLARELRALTERSRGELAALLGAELALEGGVPLALLPVRVETRSSADLASLRVRIYHDALHTEALDEGLTEAERAAGMVYWTALWNGADPAEPWPQLTAACGNQRAAWVAEALRPKNLGNPGALGPEFPDTLAYSGRPPVARTLPDRFYVRVEQDGAAPATFAGAAIPDELPVGLVDRDELQVLQLDGRDLPPIDESLRWLVDYPEAERVGMAITVPLALPGQPIRRLLVYGVRAALDPSAAAARLERLIRAHRFSDGAEFVAQGTPTNNTDSVRSGFSKRTPARPPTLTPALLDPQANAAVTAAALGVKLDAVSSLPNAGTPEQGRAAAFNTALWSTTWGDAIEMLTPQGRANGDQRLDNAQLDAVRAHWIANVRGRGPLPVLRLGQQPYGLLPVVATDASWRPLRPGFVEERLVPFIDQQLRYLWNDALPNVPTIMNRALDAALPQILGTDAVLRGLRVRSALSPDPVLKGAMALTLPNLGTSGPEVTRALLLLSGVADEALDDHALLGGKTRTLALPLVHESDQDFVAALLQPAPPPRTHRSVLQVLLAHAAAIDRHVQSSFAPPELKGWLREAMVDAELFGVDRELTQHALESVLAEAPDHPSIAQAADELALRVGRLDPRRLADRHPLAALAPRTKLQQIAGVSPQFDMLRTGTGLQLLGELFQGARWSAAFRGALETIVQIDSIEERRLLLAETLDCCSHRLDAWITAAATRRLHDLRNFGATGIGLGAYAWLENIELRAPTPAGQIDGLDVLHDAADGGYIHAPSLTHAATAGVLRSGRLTHRKDDPDSEALDIDLSSTRTRDALSLLDGMHSGQSLGALLGYRLERRLHARSGDGVELDRFIYVLRSLAPLRAGKLTDQGAAVMESMAANNVVDGLRLLEIAPAKIAQALRDGPADKSYIVPPDQWNPPSAAEASAVLEEIAQLERTHDAVADLLLAESVHQLVSGNAPRAAATLDLLGAGEAPPAEPEVVRTPKSGVPIQQRVAIVVASPPPAASVQGWNAQSARAQAEPRLEAWARSAFGDPAQIAIAPGQPLTLAQARLCALDVLYDADGDSVQASTLVARLRANFGASVDLGADLSPLAPTWELAGMLRSLLRSGRALDVADVGRAIAPGAVGRVADAAEIIGRASFASTALKAAAFAADPLQSLAEFGIRSPSPQADLPLSAAELSAAQDALITEAATRVRNAESLLQRAAAGAAARAQVELASQALAAIFGAGFVAVPVLLPAAAGEADLWSGALGPDGVRARPGSEIRPWLQRAGAIRANTYAYGESLLVRDAFGRRPQLRVVQTPAAAFPSWVGLPFPEGRPPSVPLSSMVAEFVVASSDQELSGAIAGVVLDEWTEVVPRRLERHDLAHPEAELELVDVTTTGIALNANAPGARPPQAILLALSADGADWNAERLVRVLDETMALARMRTLTLQDIPYVGRQLPALYFRDWSLQGEPVIDWLKVSTEYKPDHVLKHLDFEP